jgi:hypothetical protein
LIDTVDIINHFFSLKNGGNNSIIFPTANRSVSVNDVDEFPWNSNLNVTKW